MFPNKFRMIGNLLTYSQRSLLYKDLAQEENSYILLIVIYKKFLNSVLKYLVYLFHMYGREM